MKQSCDGGGGGEGGCEPPWVGHQMRGGVGSYSGHGTITARSKH